MNGLLLVCVTDLFHIGARFVKNNSLFKTSLKSLFHFFLPYHLWLFEDYTRTVKKKTTVNFSEYVRLSS